MRSRSTPDDWQVWIRGFSVEMLKQSPIPALRSCSGLAQKFFPLAKELFNAAFLSCWRELYDQHQDDLIRSLETAFMKSFKRQIRSKSNVVILKVACLRRVQYQRKFT
eukprot:UN06213